MRRDEQKNEIYYPTRQIVVCAGGYLLTGYVWQKYARGTDFARAQKYVAERIWRGK